MRWGLLWWNLMTVLVSSLGVEEEQVDSAEEPVEPVEPVDIADQIDQFIEQPTTRSTRLAFYEPGTDFFAIPELYRNIKAGKNTSGLYIGPTFSKEFMVKTPSEKRVTTGFKLLDWKRRRKRLDSINIKGNSKPTKTGERIKKECPGTKDKAVTESQQAEVTKSIDDEKKSVANLVNNNIKEKEYCGSTVKSTIKDDAFKGNTSINHDNVFNIKRDVGTEEPIKVYSQPLCGRKGIRINSLNKKHCETRLTNRPEHCLKFSNETGKKRHLKKRNRRSRKRSKREKESEPFENFIEYKRAIPENTHLNATKNVTEIVPHTSAYRSTTPRITHVQQLYLSSTSGTTDVPKISTSRSLSNESVSSTSHVPEETKKNLMNLATTTGKVESFTTEQDTFSTSVLSKKEVTKNVKEYKVTSTTTDSNILSSKAKAKIIINGDEMPLHQQPKTPENSVEPNPAIINVPVVFACVTPPPATTLNVVKEEQQRAECHPKGTGPLSPMTFDPEAYGPRNEEEVEDALTGKLADRVVEVVMAKVGKSPRMLKELGLYAQGNLTKIQCSINHPEGKQACKEQSSEALKMNVLQDIAAAVERLASTKSSGLCLKPREDLADFLSWLLSEDSEMDMPEPSSHLSLQPRREADYLFRSSGISDELFNEVRDIERKCNWENWMSFAEDSPDEAAGSEKSKIPDEFEGKGHVQQPKNFKRMPRHLLHRKRTVKKPGEHGRRRRYTPWSLNDYP